MSGTRYSVYRRNGDMLVILDGTAEQCRQIMRVTLCAFYKLVNVGGNGKWEITKAKETDIRRDMES